MLGRRKRCPPIEQPLALSMAGQVAIGLARGVTEDQMRTTLTAIGLMIYNASDDVHVRKTLEMAGGLSVKRAGNVTSIHYERPDGEE